MAKIVRDVPIYSYRGAHGLFSNSAATGKISLQIKISIFGFWESASLFARCFNGAIKI